MSAIEVQPRHLAGARQSADLRRPGVGRSVRPTLQVIPGLSSTEVETSEDTGRPVVPVSFAPSALELQQAKLRHPAIRGRALQGQSRPTIVVQPVHHSSVSEKARIRQSPWDISSLVKKAVGYLVMLLIVVGVGAGVGLAMRPAPFEGEVWDHSVSAGESLWSIAERLDAPKPIGDVIEDIRALNDLRSDHLIAGDRILLPSY